MSFINDKYLDQDKYVSQGLELRAQMLKMSQRPLLVTYFNIFPQHIPYDSFGSDDYGNTFNEVRRYPIYEYDGAIADLSVTFDPDAVSSSIDEINATVLPYTGITAWPGDIIRIELPGTTGHFLLFRAISVNTTTVGPSKAYRIKFGLIPAQVMNEIKVRETFEFNFNEFIEGNAPLIPSKDVVIRNKLTKLRESMSEQYMKKFLGNYDTVGWHNPRDREIIHDPVVATMIYSSQLFENLGIFSSSIMDTGSDQVTALAEETGYGIITGDYSEQDAIDLGVIRNAIAVSNSLSITDPGYPSFLGSVMNYTKDHLPVNVNPEDCSPKFFENCTGPGECEQMSALRLTPLYRWDDGSCHDAPDPSAICNENNPHLCLNPSDCYAAGFYWWTLEKICKSEPEPDCSPGNYELCINQRACDAANGYWWDGKCHEEPRCHVTHPELCSGEIECIQFGLNWYDDGCHAITQCEADPDFCLNVASCLATGRFWVNERCQDDPDTVTDPATILDITDCINRGLFWWDGACHVEPECHSTHPEGCVDSVACVSAGMFWWPSESVCKIFPEPTCTKTDQSGCTEFLCIFYEMFWYGDTCHVEPECHFTHPEGCVDSVACISAGMFWYGDTCHVEPECRYDNPSGCYSESDCLFVGLFWWDGACHVEPECHFTHPEGCVDSVACISAGMFWYGDTCHVEPEQICSTYYPELCISGFDCLSVGNTWDYFSNVCLEAPVFDPDMTEWNWNLSEADMITEDISATSDFVSLKQWLMFRNGEDLPIRIRTGEPIPKEVIEIPAMVPFHTGIVSWWQQKNFDRNSTDLYFVRKDGAHTSIGRFDGMAASLIYTCGGFDRIIPMDHAIYVQLTVGKKWEIIGIHKNLRLSLPMPNMKPESVLHDISRHYDTYSVPGYYLNSDSTGLYVSCAYSVRLLTTDPVNFAVFSGNGAIYQKVSGEVWYVPEIRRCLNPEFTLPEYCLFTPNGILPVTEMFDPDGTQTVFPTIMPVMSAVDIPNPDNLFGKYTVLQAQGMSLLFDPYNIQIIKQFEDTVKRVVFVNSYPMLVFDHIGVWELDPVSLEVTPYFNPEYSVEANGFLIETPERNTSNLVLKDVFGRIYIWPSEPQLISTLRLQIHDTLYPPVTEPELPVGGADFYATLTTEADCVRYNGFWLSCNVCVENTPSGIASGIQREFVSRMIGMKYSEDFLNSFGNRGTLYDVITMFYNNEYRHLSNIDIDGGLRRITRKISDAEMFYLFPVVLSYLKNI